MSGAAILRELLAQHPPVLLYVPDARSVRAGILPQGSPVPALTSHTISEEEIPTLARLGKNKTLRERVQVTALARDYSSMKRLLKAAALGPGVYTGAVLGYRVKSILPAGVGPEIPPGDDGIYEQSRDFVVTYVEAN